ncbi:recombination regulator RecX [Pelistega ratti]|nr:recombination regulator RecX [Pelistega ratti]
MVNKETLNLKDMPEQFKKSSKQKRLLKAKEIIQTLSVPSTLQPKQSQYIEDSENKVGFSKNTGRVDKSANNTNSLTSNHRKQNIPRKTYQWDGGFEMDTDYHQSSADEMPYQTEEIQTTNGQPTNIPSSKPINLLNKAVMLLSRREYSEQELRQKLYRYTDDEVAINQVITRLQKEKWQSDTRFAENFVSSKQTRWGSQKIIQALSKHHLEQDTLVDIKMSLRETEYERALVVWNKKFKGQKATTPQEKAKQMRFLASRGFSADIVRKIVF